MNNPVLKAIVSATGDHVEVYKHQDGGYVDFKDCTTRYTKNELRFLKEKP